MAEIWMTPAAAGNLVAWIMSDYAGARGRCTNTEVAIFTQPACTHFLCSPFSNFNSTKMASKSRFPRQHTTAVLKYYQVPFGEEDERLPNLRPINLHDAEFTSRRCVMTDIRGQETDWSLLDNGAQIIKTNSSATNSDLEAQVLKM